MSQYCAGGSVRLCPPPDHAGCPQDWRGQSTPQGSGGVHTRLKGGSSFVSRPIYSQLQVDYITAIFGCQAT